MYAHHLRLVLKHFAMMWGLTAIGIFIGNLLPPFIVYPILILNLILLIIVLFVRNVFLANGILYAIPFFTGIMLFWIARFFIEALGFAFVLSILTGTAILFMILALLGLKMPRDFSNWGTYLTAILLILVLFSVIFIFIPVGNRFHLLMAALFVAVFVLFTVYDFNLIRNRYVKEEQIVFTALNLYLDFINLFIHLLDFIYRLRKE